MTFQPGSQNPAGEVLYDDGLQQFLRASSMQAPSMQAPSMQQYAAEPFYYLSQSSSSVPYQSVEHDYTRICPQTFSEDLLPQPSPESDTVQKKASDEILSALDELKQGITSVQTKCDELAATISKLHDWMKTSIDEMNEYIERHRAWSLFFKRAVESQMRDRDRTRDRASGSEGSSVESQGD